MVAAVGRAVWAAGRAAGLVLGHAPGQTADGGGRRAGAGQHKRHQAAGGTDAGRGGKDEVAILRNSFIELARKITQQWDRLADSDRQRREFIANISHDLRTPLTSLLGYLETLSLKSATLTPQEHQQYLATALRQGQKSGIFRSSCLSWRALNTAVLNPSASGLRWRS